MPLSAKAPARKSESLEDLLEKFQGNAYSGMLAHLGQHLGVSAESLARLGLGWSPITPTKKGWNFQGLWVIPERDAFGEVVGLSLRSRDDRKWMYPGSKHGLIYEINPEHERGGAAYQHGAHNWLRTMEAGINCPLCKKGDGCVISAENPEDPQAVICIRVKEGAVRPMKLGWLHVLKPEGNSRAGVTALANRGGPVLIVEGATDVAAAMDIGFDAVGRPSNLACMDMLGDLIRGRRVIIIGENDRKEDGREPGKEGAIAAFQVLKRVTADVTWLMPPEHVKDLRAWVVKFGLTRDGLLEYATAKGQREAKTAESEAVVTAVSSFTDAGNAIEFVRDHRQRVLYCPQQNRFYRYNDGVYAPATLLTDLATQTARHRLADAIEEPDPDRRTAAMKHAISSLSVNRLKALVELAKPELAIDVNQLDRDPWLLNTRNCVVDLRDGKTYPHNPKLFLTKITNANYDPDARAPVFHGFFRRIFRSNPALVPFMQRLIGYGATGSTREQVLVFGYGGGCNGKSTLFDAIAFPLGDYCGRAAPDLLMSADRSGHPAAVADLFGKRLMLCNEVREGRRFDGAMVKQLTGETQIKARHMYGDFFEFPATHKLVIFSNHKPIVTEADWGFWRRMLLIPFTETIAESEKDYALPEKLKAEADGILTWIVRGACQWYREGLGVPSEVSDATRQYRSEMDVIGTFITECCVDGDRLTAYATALYETYRQWADANGEYVASQKKFGSQLRDRGYRSDRCGKTGRMVWFGLAAKEPVGDSRPHGRIIFN